MVERKVHIVLKDGRAGYRKGKQETAVLQELNLNLSAGSMIGLAGLNGSGKSTLLRTLAGLQPLLSGTLLLAGKTLDTCSKQEIARQVAVVLTERPSGFNLKVRDLVSSGQMPYTGLFHRLDQANLAVIEEAAHRCGIQNYMHLPLHELSDGMFQKTMIAKALAQQTTVLLLDEPSAFLDYASRHQLFALLRELASEDGKCVVISSHDLDLSLRYCDSILFAGGGKVRELSAAEAATDPDFNQMAGGFLRS